MSRIIIFFLVLSSFYNNYAQTQTAKEVNHQAQTWVSLNTNYKFNDRWGMMNDVHIRRTDFAAKENFYFARI